MSTHETHRIGSVGLCRKSAMLMATLLTALFVLLRPAVAQAIVPGPRVIAPLECISERDAEYVQDGQHYSVVTINDGVPNCTLRNAYRQHPILGEDGQPLEIQDWLRSVYAANKKMSGTVHRGCIRLQSGRFPEGATIEEQLFCKEGMVNYFGIKSGATWRSYIYIPTTQWYTEFELKAAVAQHACKVLERVPNPSDEVNGALKECYSKHITPPPPPPAQPAPDAQPKDDLPNDIPALKQLVRQGREQIDGLQRQIEELKLTLMDATRSRPFRPNAWTFMVVGLVLAGAGAGWRQRRTTQDLNRRIGYQRTELERLAEVAQMVAGSQLEQARLAEVNGQLTADNQALQAKTKEQEATIGRQTKEADEQLATHMNVVRTLRERHDAEQQKWHARLDHLNGLIKRWKEANDAQAKRLAEQEKTITRLEGQHEADRNAFHARETQMIELEAQNVALQAHLDEHASSQPPSVTPLPTPSVTPSPDLSSTPESMVVPAPGNRKHTLDFPAVRAACPPSVRPRSLQQLESWASDDIAALLSDILSIAAQRWQKPDGLLAISIPDEDDLLKIWCANQTIGLSLGSGLLAVLGVDDGHFRLSDVPELVSALRIELPTAQSAAHVPATGRTIVPDRLK